MSEILWQPSPERIAQTRMEAFRHLCNQRHALAITDYPALHQWSIDQREDFWQAIVDYFGITFHQPPETVLREGRQMPSAQWFPGATLNFAEHLLRRRDDAVAVIAIGEDGQREQLSFAELASHVAGLQKSLQAAGVGLGDRVAACMPNTWQTLVGMLATTSLGAVWSCSSPDFGTQGVIDRFGQIEPKVLITCAGYHYAGKAIDQTLKLNEILQRLPSLEHLIIVPYARPQARTEDYASQARISLWQDFYQPAASLNLSPCPLPTRCTSSIPAAPPACPNASSTAPVACSCNTSRNTAYTSTSGPPTDCSTTPPAAG